MKIYSFFLIASMLPGVCATAQTNPAEELAQRQALRMKNNLVLDTGQYRKIMNINRWLCQQKLAVRQQTANIDSLSAIMQQIENKRDSLYQAVLPENKFHLYKQQKTILISNQ